MCTCPQGPCLVLPARLGRVLPLPAARWRSKLFFLCNSVHSASGTMHAAPEPNSILHTSDAMLSQGKRQSRRGACLTQRCPPLHVHRGRMSDRHILLEDPPL